MEEKVFRLLSDGRRLQIHSTEWEPVHLILREPAEAEEDEW